MQKRVIKTKKLSIGDTYMGGRWMIVQLTDDTAILETHVPVFKGVSATKEILIKELLNYSQD